MMKQARALVPMAVAGFAAAILVVGAHAADPTPLPTAIVGMGDSLTAGWGSDGIHADDTTPANAAGSWATGTNAIVNSHRTRLEALGATALSVFNHAASGTSVTDLTGGLKAQATKAVADHADYVMIEGGSADLCRGAVNTVDKLTSAAAFRSAVDNALAELVQGRPNVKILVASIPDWFGIWQRTQSVTRPASTCPLLFGTVANDTTRAAVQQRTLAYNTELAASCAQHSTNCKYDGGAVHALPLGLTDLSTVDFFHPSFAGQAKLAAATWDVGWYASTGTGTTTTATTTTATTTTTPPATTTASPPAQSTTTAATTTAATTTTTATTAPFTPPSRSPSGAAALTRILGTRRADTLRAPNGGSLIRGLAGSDRIVGGNGPDVVWAGPGADTVFGGAGNDAILAGTDRDRVFAGAGNDLIWAADGWRDQVECGPGRDRVVVDRWDVVAGDCERVTRG